MISVWRFAPVRRLALVAVVVLAAVPVPGCGSGAAESAAVLKDPPPLAPEETTEGYMKQQAKAKAGPKARLPRR